MNRLKVTIVDYGLGNLLSVKRAFEHLNVDVEISDSPAKIETAERLIIPGVGAFPRGIEEMEKRNLVESIKIFNDYERPIMAICLGMQLLMEFGEEHKKTAGLELIKGNVVKFPDQKTDWNQTKIPHIGWSELNLYSGNHKYEKFKNFQQKQMYFVHSYYVNLANNQDLLATTNNGTTEFCSVLYSNNILGCQFHPEKSGPIGLNLIKEFIKY